jgi:dTDP-4-dehydrorhamnose reductase
MKDILITGATGLLGGTLINILRANGYSVITHAITSSADFQADLSSTIETFELLNQIKPDIIINLVGQISVELCQENPNIAYLANTRSVENLVQWIENSNTGCHLIHISTDHLYDGVGPHNEEHVNLTNNYAFSKYAGELAAIRVRSTILRTNFIGRSNVSHRESLTDWVYTSLSMGKTVQVLGDIYFNPLSMTTLSNIICLVVGAKPFGVFNLGSRGGMSKADFDFYFAECLGLQTVTMSRIDSSEATFLKAYRPKDMRMNCKKFEDRFKMTLPELVDEIRLAAEDYRE